jgi:hypothetical protein
MFALIDPTTAVTCISKWSPISDPDPKKSNIFVPIIEEIVDSARVCQIVDEQFLIASPLFWVECGPDIVPELCYYKKSDSTFSYIVNAPHPFPDGPPKQPQPVTFGINKF